MEVSNETWLNSLNGDKLYCPDYTFLCRKFDSNWKYIKNPANISVSPRQTMMGFFWGERVVWGGNTVKLLPLITVEIRFYVFCSASCIWGTSRWLTWLNIHLNSYLLLQDFIINFFIFYVYMVILLFEQLKTGTQWKLFTRGKKNLLLALSNSNNCFLKNH